MTAEKPTAHVQHLMAGSLKILCLLTGPFMWLLCGCSLLRYVPPAKLPYEKLAAAYNHTQLKVSNTLDVLGIIRAPEWSLNHKAVSAQLLSQSDTMVAMSGQSKDLYKTWFNMFVFDEHTMTANRKYFFCIDEKATLTLTEPRHLMVPPKKALIFDTQMVLDSQVLDKPYAADEAKQIAILKQVAENLKTDIQQLSGNQDEPTQGNKLLTASAIMMNQTFDGILLELRRSPALARQLSDTDGIPFSHISLDKGRIRMVLQDDTVTLRIRVHLPMQ